MTIQMFILPLNLKATFVTTVCYVHQTDLTQGPLDKIPDLLGTNQSVYYVCP